MDDATNNYLNTYREALDTQYQAAKDQLAQQRTNDFTTIMSQANKAGSLYSNIPQRSKIQYDTGTYLPSLTKAYTTYQTGLGKLRENVANYQNQVKALEDAIADLNAGTIISSSMY